MYTSRGLQVRGVIASVISHSPSVSVSASISPSQHPPVSTGIQARSLMLDCSCDLITGVLWDHRQDLTDLSHFTVYIKCYMAIMGGGVKVVPPLRRSTGSTNRKKVHKYRLKNRKQLLAAN